jgi:hypothetical protein
MECVRAGRLGILLGALVLAIAPTASAHRIAAQGAGVCWDGELCFETHLEGHGEVGIPGLNADFSHFDTSVNSDTGHLAIFGTYSWIEGATKPATPVHFDDYLEEGVFLERIADGPVTLRATLTLEDGGMIDSPDTSIRLIAAVSFGACGITVTKTLYEVVVTDWQKTGGGDCAEIVGSQLVVTSTYDGDLPTDPMVTARIQSDYFGLYKPTVFDYGYKGDLQVDLINASATWDTPTFLTDAPEPADDALGVAAVGVLVVRRARSRRRT